MERLKVEISVIKERETRRLKWYAHMRTMQQGSKVDGQEKPVSGRKLGGEKEDGFV